jgi:hypothetical protein
MGAKRKIVALTMALGALLAGTIAPTAAAAKEKSNRTDQSRRVCRSVTPIGTRLATRVCRPAAEWAEMESKEQKGVIERQSEGFVRNTPVGDMNGVVPR